MTYTPALIVHIAGGILAVVFGIAAIVLRKGSRLHRASGNIFVVSMLFMAAGGAFVAFQSGQVANTMMAIFTTYLVSTAWLAVRRKAGQTGRLELILFAILLADLVIGLFFGSLGTKEAKAFFIIAAIYLLFAASDVRMFIRGGLFGMQRIARHLWRMGLALFIAVGSFFIGLPGDPVLRRTGIRGRLFTQAVRDTRLPLVPVLLVVVLTLYWLIRVKFAASARLAAQEVH